jgi:hypothetical protein
MKSQLIAATLTLSTLITAATAGTFANISPSGAQTTVATGLSRTFCPIGEESIATKVKVFAETKSYLVNICKGVDKGSGSFYASRAKNRKAGDAYIPISTSKKGFYSARNSNYIYTLDLNNKYLRVYQGKKLVLQEQLYNVRYF